jgi:hypothetical protein
MVRTRPDRCKPTLWALVQGEMRWAPDFVFESAISKYNRPAPVMESRVCGKADAKAVSRSDLRELDARRWYRLVECVRAPTMDVVVFVYC